MCVARHMMFMMLLQLPYFTAGRLLLFLLFLLLLQFGVVPNLPSSDFGVVSEDTHVCSQRAMLMLYLV